MNSNDLSEYTVMITGTTRNLRVPMGTPVDYVARVDPTELAQLVTDGKSEQEIVDYYLAKYGSQEPLAEPIDRGFNRLAWAVPYLLGASGLALVATVAIKWSRRRDTGDVTPVGSGAPVADAELESRLDDELRDLD